MAMIDNIQENVRRGFTEMLILKLLSEKDMYVYQINQELEKRTDGLFKIKCGSSYGPLYRMLSRKYISERKEFVGDKRFRMYYHLLPEGLEYYKKLKHECWLAYFGVSKMINLADDIENQPASLTK